MGFVPRSGLLFPTRTTIVAGLFLPVSKYHVNVTYVTLFTLLYNQTIMNTIACHYDKRQAYDFGKTLGLCENVFLNNLIFALFYLHKSHNIGS